MFNIAHIANHVKLSEPNTALCAQGLEPKQLIKFGRKSIILIEELSSTGPGER